MIDDRPQPPTDAQERERAAAREQALATIERNIADKGVHLYLVLGDSHPRWAYTIGLHPDTGVELVLAGAHAILRDDVPAVLNAAVALVRATPALAQDPFAVLDLGGHGRFRLRPVHESWSSRMLLGALDFYALETVGARQLVPVAGTADVPDMTVPWDPASAPAWRFLESGEREARWRLDLPPRSYAVVDLPVLAGAPVLHAARWSLDEWEVFAEPEVTPTADGVRLVPLVVVLGLDPALEQVLGAVPPGEGVVREGVDAPWERLELDLDDDLGDDAADDLDGGAEEEQS